MMRINYLKISCYIFALALLLPRALFAAHNDSQVTQSGEKESVQCVSLLRECFSYHGYNRSNCFFTTATHPFCDGSELGSLAYRRWVLSPGSESAKEDSTGETILPSGHSETAVQAFLGPQIVDRACIEKSDELLQSSLRIDSIALDTVRKIAAGLEGCRRDLGLELRRP
jgi:hypothetical protein